ncbi:MAG: hypothetical protein JW866_10345 [Ignavibacteriales bacterium]|nr:hypothetical protein [Ignavibacteriales bacterium]
MKHNITYILFLVFFGVLSTTSTFAQKVDPVDSKVDSIFNSYFDFLTRDILGIDTTDYDLQAKESEMAFLIYDFFENISGHFQQRQLFSEHDYPKIGKIWYCYSTNNGFSKVCVINTDEDFESWRNWYNNNKSSLIWIDDDKKIQSKSSNEFYYLDYITNYPSEIRFKDKLDWIPMSQKPKQVLDLEKQMDKAGLLEPKYGEIK